MISSKNINKYNQKNINKMSHMLWAGRKVALPLSISVKYTLFSFRDLNL